MALVLPSQEIVGHIPREISRAVKYFILRGGEIQATVVSTRRRVSPIEQGGLEIPLQITASHSSSKIMDILKQFIVLNNSHYKDKSYETNKQASANTKQNQLSTLSRSIVKATSKEVVVISDSDDKPIAAKISKVDMQSSSATE